MSNNNVPATRAQSSLAIQNDQDYWSDKQLAALRQLGVKDAAPADLAVFFHQAVRTGLDPFARQIYLIGRRQKDGDQWVTKQTIQTGIDGFRLIARRATDRSKGTFGYEDTRWCGEDGVWRDVWLSSTPPAAAKVVVVRDGQRFPGIALYTDYVQRKRDGSPTSMWEKAALMLAKCAEALALRMAFPQDLSGLYTGDEMMQADNAAISAGQRPPQAARVVDAAPAVEPVNLVEIQEILDSCDDEKCLKEIYDELVKSNVPNIALVRPMVTEALNRIRSSATAAVEADAPVDEADYDQAMLDAEAADHDQQLGGAA